MNFKTSLLISFGAMVILYLIGFIGDIDYLAFKISQSTTEIAFLPIVVGLVLAFVCDRIIKLKSQKHSN